MTNAIIPGLKTTDQDAVEARVEGAATARFIYDLRPFAIINPGHNDDN